jgi:porin
MVLGLTIAMPARAEDGCEDGRPIADGLCLSAQGTLDMLGTVRGGVRQGAIATGMARLGLDADLGTLAALDGWHVRAVVMGIYGRSATATLTGGLAPTSNIEALPSARLDEFWVQRDLGGWGTLRAGQIVADTEFLGADAATLLVNFGWPAILAGMLPAGGPSYPLAVPGLRLALGDPDNGTGFRIALFAGNPAGRPGDAANPQRHNRFGTNFSLAGGAFAIAEAVTGGTAPAADSPRPWVAKLGAWFFNGGTDSQRRDAAGLSLADPASSGVARRYRNDFGGYAIGEAMLWRGEEGSLNSFLRVFAAPSDRNLVAAQLDAGLAWRGPFGRQADTLTLAVSVAQIGAAARGLDRDRQALGEVRTRRDQETLLELNYDYAVMPGHLSLRPVLQWVGHPAAREPDARASATRPLRDVVLLGMRVTATF